MVPLRTLNNWACERKKWCPTLTCVRLHGTKKERADTAHELVKHSGYNVVLTTVEALTCELPSLRKVEFECVWGLHLVRPHASTCAAPDFVVLTGTCA